MEVKQIAKSKTVHFNVWMPIVLALLPQFGIVVTPELIAAILALGNIILRFITKQSVEEK